MAKNEEAILQFAIKRGEEAVAIRNSLRCNPSNCPNIARVVLSFEQIDLILAYINYVESHFMITSPSDEKNTDGESIWKTACELHDKRVNHLNSVSEDDALAVWMSMHLKTPIMSYHAGQVPTVLQLEERLLEVFMDGLSLLYYKTSSLQFEGYSLTARVLQQTIVDADSRTMDTTLTYMALHLHHLMSFLVPYLNGDSSEMQFLTMKSIYEAGHHYLIDKTRSDQSKIFAFHWSRAKLLLCWLQYATNSSVIGTVEVSSAIKENKTNRIETTVTLCDFVLNHLLLPCIRDKDMSSLDDYDVFEDLLFWLTSTLEAYCVCHLEYPKYDDYSRNVFCVDRCTIEDLPEEFLFVETLFWDLTFSLTSIGKVASLTSRPHADWSEMLKRKYANSFDQLMNELKFHFRVFSDVLKHSNDSNSVFALLCND